MIDLTLCNYPGYIVELMTWNYCLIPIGLLIIFFIIGLRYFGRKGLKDVFCSLVFSIIITLILLFVIPISQFYAQGSASKQNVSTLNFYLTTLNKSGFSVSEIRALKDYAQCAIQDGDISTFEFEQFEERYNRIQTSHNSKNAINKIRASIDSQ